MITLDKIKIIAPIESVVEYNEDIFQAKIVKDTLIDLSYTQLTPYNLYVEVDYKENELVLDFSGKILLDKYPQLINQNTIRECLENINKLGICQLDIDTILKYGEVCSIDVTKDITYQDCKGLCDYLRTHLCNHKRYLAQQIGNNLVIKKNVKTRSYQRTLTIYDKHKEILKAENRPFVTLCGGEGFVADFMDKVRFELRLNSKDAIRKDLNITDNSIFSILNADARPIWNFIDTTIKEDSVADCCLTVRDCERLAMLEKHKGDLVSVAAELQAHTSTKTHISETMKPYRKLLQKISVTQSGLKTILQGLLLLEIFLILPIFWL